MTKQLAIATGSLYELATDKKDTVVYTACGGGACLGVEINADKALRFVKIENGVATQGFPITQEELKTFIDEAANGAFDRLLA